VGPGEDFNNMIIRIKAGEADIRHTVVLEPARWRKVIVVPGRPASLRFAVWSRPGSLQRYGEAFSHLEQFTFRNCRWTNIKLFWKYM